MTASLLPWPRAKFFAPNTNFPLAGGKVYTYAAGTNTPLATYTDSSQGVANTNPVILDAQGEASIWLGAGLSYKIDLFDASNVHIAGFPVDNVSDSGSLLRADLANTSNVLLGDALVGVKQPYTGAVATTQHNKNAETISITDFGGLGDGSNDDAVALNAAIAAAGTKGWKIFIPPAPGSGWTFNTMVTINKPGITISGAGTQAGELAPSITPKGVVITQKAGANLDAMIKIIAAGCRLENITLDGNALNQASGTGRGLWVQETTGALPQLSFTILSDFNVTRTRGIGIDCAPVGGGIVDRMQWYSVNVRDTYGTNVSLQDIGDSDFFGLNCGGAFNADAHNLQITTCRRLKFHGGLGDFAGNGIAVNVFQGSELQFFGYQAEAAGKHGWYFDSSSEVDLIGCQARNNGNLDVDVYGGFYFAGTCNNIRVNNCRAWDTATPKTQDYGVVLATTGAGIIQFANCDFADNLTGPINSSAAAFVNKSFVNCRPYESPAVNAYRSGADQSIANNTFVKIQINAEDTDTAGWFDTTNNRFLPLLPGNYTLSWGVDFASAAAGICFSTLYKNGTRNKDGTQLTLNASFGTLTTGTATVQANGTTDYFEVFAYQNSGGAINAQVSSPIYPYFTAVRVAG